MATGQLVTKMTDPALQTSSSGLPGIGHRDLVQSLTFNKDGDLLASGGFREVKLWRRPRDVQSLNIAAGVEVRAMKLSPDRRWIATNGVDHTVQLWNCADGKPATRLVGHEAHVTGIRFSSDGTIVYSSSLDGTVRIWDHDTGDAIGQIDVQSPVNDVALVPTTVAKEKEPHPTTLIVTAGEDKVVRVWSVNLDDTGQTSDAVQTREISSHSQPVTCLARVPVVANQLVSGSRDGTMRWWRIDNGSQIRQFSHGGPVLAVAVRSDGQAFASSGENNSAKLWRTNGQQIAELKGDLGRNTVVVRAKQQLASAASRVAVAKRQAEDAEKDVPKKTDAEKKISEALAKANKDVEEKQTVLNKAKAEKTKVETEAIAASAAARDALSAKEQAQSLSDRAAKNVITAQTRVTRLQQVSVTAPGNEQLKKLLEEAVAAVPIAQKEAQQLVTAIQEPTKKLQELTNKANEIAKKVDEKQKPFNEALAALSKAEAAENLLSQQHVLAATELKRAQELVPVRKKGLAGAETAQQAAQERVTAAESSAKEAEAFVHALAFSRDGNTLLTAGAFNVVHSWDANTGAALSSWSGHVNVVSACVFVDDATIVSGSTDKSIRMWEANPGWRLERTIGSSDDSNIITHRVTSTDFSYDGAQLLVGSGVPSRNGELSVFHVADGQRVLHLPKAHDDVVYSARFSPDAARIASAGADKYLRTFDVAASEQLRRFEGHTNYVLSVAWKSDGQTLASSAADNTIKIWDSETGDQRRTVTNFKKHITGIRFVGDTDDVFATSGDKSVRRIRSTNGGNIRGFTGPDTWIHCCDITPDGKVAAAGDASGNLYLWDGNTGRLLHKLN